MENDILTKYVVLHFDNKTLPKLSLQEADKYLHQIAEKLEQNQTTAVNIDIVFDDGMKINEQIVIKELDSIVDNIIRYHVIGIIRYKAGLLPPTLIDKSKYDNELKNIDTEFYKNIYENYSLFYSRKKASSNINGLTGVLKLKEKFKRLKNKELSKIQTITYKIRFYDGVIEGIEQYSKQEGCINLYTEKLNALTDEKEEYHYIKGILHACELAGNC